MRRVIPTILLAAAVLLVSGSCSTKKNTWSSRQYHNLTARFNVNFNAKESFKEARKKTEAIYPQTFDEILPVFAFTYPDAASATSSDLDRVITKSNKLIATHSITAKPKRKGSSTAEERKFYNKHEFCDMVDDAHLYIGKSKMYMQQYEEASPIFQSIVINYPDQNTVLEARIWLAIAAAERGTLDLAEEQLTVLETKLRRDKKTEVSKQVELALNSAWADIYIKKGQYSEAIPRLTNALSKTSLKATKARYRFILAQLYERTGNNNMATAYYDKVAKMNVPYEVEFSALMSKANTMSDQSQRGELEKMYKKMLKDEKNSEYVDQLYYALGNLSKTQGDTTNAIAYYKQSVAASSSNDMQKGLSSLALGSSYYNAKHYLPAFNAYDSAAIWLSGHPQQKNAETMANKLRRVGISLAVVEREDSLQRIAQLSPQERQKYAEAQASEAVERQQKAAQAVPQYGSYQYNMQQSGGINPTAGQGSNQWYFYNTMALNQGANDFKMRWGQRKLEDNWRRKNKSMAPISEAEKADEILTDTEISDIITLDKKTETSLTPTSAEYYLQNVPLTEESLKASNSRIERALFNLATGYQTDIKDNALAQATFKQLLDRFPQSENRPAAYYSMYQLLTESGNSGEAEQYKSRLIAEFPKDKMALSLQNPNYVADLNRMEAESEQKYEQALTLYRNGNNAEALNMANSAMVTYQGLPTEANFALLKTLATSYNGNVAGYKQDLQKVVKDYPASSAAIAAKNILAMVEKEEVRLLSPEAKAPTSTTTTPSTTAPTTTTTPPSTVVRTEGVSENITADQAYGVDEGARHYVLVVVNKDVQINKLAFDIALYNADHFLNQNYELMEESSIDDTHKAIVIRTFENKEEAMTYYDSLVNKSLVISSQPAGSSVCVAISIDNFERLKLKKSLADYVSFFQQNYLPK